MAGTNPRVSTRLTERLDLHMATEADKSIDKCSISNRVAACNQTINQVLKVGAVSDFDSRYSNLFRPVVKICEMSCILKLGVIEATKL